MRLFVRLLFLILSASSGNAHAASCSVWKFHALTVMESSERSANFDVVEVARSIQASPERYEILDELQRRRFDLDWNVQFLERMIVDPSLNELVKHAARQALQRFLRSRERLANLLGRFLGAPRRFDIPEFRKFDEGYSTPATLTGLRYRGNSDFVRETVRLEDQVKAKIAIVEQQLRSTQLSEQQELQLLTELSQLSAEAAYYREMREVSEGKWTGIASETFQQSLHRPRYFDLTSR